MADYATLKTSIQAAIKQNGNNEITGPILQQALLAMINSIGAGYQFIGVATPATNPGTPDYKCFYIASEPGTYTNFVDSGSNPIVVNDGDVAVLKYDTAWSKENTGIKPVSVSQNTLTGGSDLYIGDQPAIKGITQRLHHATGNIADMTLTYDYNGGSPTISMAVAAPGYLYTQFGYIIIGSETISLGYTSVGTDLIVYYRRSADGTRGYLTTTNSILNVPANAVIIECWNLRTISSALTVIPTWTSPFIKKVSVTLNGSGFWNAYYNPMRTDRIDFMTRLLSISLRFVKSGSTITIEKISGTDGYIYAPFTFDTIPAALSFPITLTITAYATNIVYWDTTSNTFAITTDISHVTGKNIVLFVFYANAAYTAFSMFVASSPNIETTGFGSIWGGAYNSYGIPGSGEDVKKPDSIKIIKRIGVIGDSYAEGFIQQNPIPSGQVDIDNEYAWPHYLSILTGASVSNFGKSGSTTKLWMNGYGHLDEVQAVGNKCQAYIIGLLINDKDSVGNVIPCGVVSDIGTDNDTYYAWYYKLIQAVVSVNSDAKIFLCTCPRYASNDAYNEAVRDLAEYCKNAGQNVYLADLCSGRYSSYWDNAAFAADGNGHYSAIGYQWMAQGLYSIISDVINANVLEFRDVNLIDYDAE